MDVVVVPWQCANQVLMFASVAPQRHASMVVRTHVKEIHTMGTPGTELLDVNVVV